MLSTLLTLLTATVAATGNTSTSPFKWGHAAYTYGPLHCTSSACDVVPSCNTAHWASDVEQHNLAADTEGYGADSYVDIVYSYGGDIEFWSGKGHEQGCWAPASTDPTICNVSIYFDQNNLKAAEAYSTVHGVKSIVMLIDSRMDGWEQIKTYDDFDGCKFGNFYPDLRNLTDAASQKLAKDTAKLYCASDLVDGVQVDLEPYRDPYKKSLQKYLGYVAKEMVDADSSNSCRNAKHPEGRTVSYFTFAHNHEVTFNDVLGKNGYYVFSGYDLFPKDADGGFMYNTPDEFGDNLFREFSYFLGVTKPTKQKFTLALPFGASCHEYEQYVPMKGEGCGPACKPLDNSPTTMADYVQTAFDIILSPNVTEMTRGLFCMSEADDSQFLGISWWSFSWQMTYPPMKWFDNEFLPGTPPADALAIVRKNLPKLQGGVTCLTDAQKAAIDAKCPTTKGLGCPCKADSDCSSMFGYDTLCKNDACAIQVPLDSRATQRKSLRHMR